MDRQINEVRLGQGGNYILPFLWLRGEGGEAVRREMEKIDECGIKAVCLESRPHPDFAGPDWWRDVDVALKEARERGMKVWILDDAHFPTGMANGLLPKKYPERAKQYLAAKSFDVVGPLARAELDLAQAMTKSIAPADTGRPEKSSFAGEQRLVSVIALRLVEGDKVTAEAAREDGRGGDTDIEVAAALGRLPERFVLTDKVRDGKLVFDFPSGVWRVFVIYTTYDEGARNDYINVIDEQSVQVLIEAVYEPHYERYAEEFGRTIAGFFSDEPGFGNTSGFDFDEKVGRKDMALPWSGDLPELLAERLGESWAEKLPLLFGDSCDGGGDARIRYAYMDAVTRLYQRNFSEQLGKWCADRGVEYIGHVIEDNNAHARLGCGAGHYFRAMSGQTMAGIDNIGGQIVPGNPYTVRRGFCRTDGPFFHFTLAKLGASAALMQAEKGGRLMCETFGAYGWGFGVRDMKWVADWLLSRGVNHLVPHAFSMAPYPDPDCPPHFYAGGRNPEFPYFARLMRYCNRLCHVFSCGKWIPEVGIYYHAELEWMDDCMMDEVPARVLGEGHIDYAFVPADVLADAAGCGEGRYPVHIANGRLVVNGVPLKLLIVPRAKYADPVLLRFMEVCPEVNVIFVDAAPENLDAVAGKRDIAAENRDDVLQVVPLEELVSSIKSMGVIGARADVRGEASFFHYEKDDGDLWMVFNESMSETIHGSLLMKLGGGDRRVWRYDAMKNKIYPVEQLLARGFDEPRMLCTLKLPPYESAVFFTAREAEVAGLCEEADPWERVETGRTDVSRGWKVEIAEAADEPAFRPLKVPVRTDGTLCPVSDVLPDFSGFMRYSRELEIADPAKCYELEAEHFYEVGRVLVNGAETDFRLCPPYRFDLGNALKAGKNHIVIEAANTPLRDARKSEMGSAGCEKGFYEPSGVFGEITLIGME